MYVCIRCWILELEIVVSYYYGCWELNLGSLEEHSVLLTTEPSLQPLLLFLRKVISQVGLVLDISELLIFLLPPHMCHNALLVIEPRASYM